VIFFFQNKTHLKQIFQILQFYFYKQKKQNKQCQTSNQTSKCFLFDSVKTQQTEKFVVSTSQFKWKLYENVIEYFKHLNDSSRNDLSESGIQQDRKTKQEQEQRESPLRKGHQMRNEP
jgi:hypothetical protein